MHHFISIIEAKSLVLCMEKTGVHCENHTKYVEALCVHNVEFFSAASGGTFSNHFVIKLQFPTKYKSSYFFNQGL